MPSMFLVAITPPSRFDSVLKILNRACLPKGRDLFAGESDLTEDLIRVLAQHRRASNSRRGCFAQTHRWARNRNRFLASRVLNLFEEISRLHLGIGQNFLEVITRAAWDARSLELGYRLVASSLGTPFGHRLVDYMSVVAA